MVVQGNVAIVHGPPDLARRSRIEFARFVDFPSALLDETPRRSNQCMRSRLLQVRLDQTWFGDRHFNHEVSDGFVSPRWAFASIFRAAMVRAAAAAACGGGARRGRASRGGRACVLP